MKDKRLFSKIYLVCSKNIYVFSINSNPIIYRQFFILSKAFYFGIFNYLYHYKITDCKHYLHYELVINNVVLHIDDILDYSYVVEVLGYNVYIVQTNYYGILDFLKSIKTNLLKQFKLFSSCDDERDSIQAKLNHLEQLADSQLVLKASSIRQLKSIYIRRNKKIAISSANLFLKTFEDIDKFIYYEINKRWNLHSNTFTEDTERPITTPSENYMETAIDIDFEWVEEKTTDSKANLLNDNFQIN